MNYNKPAIPKGTRYILSRGAGYMLVNKAFSGFVGFPKVPVFNGICPVNTAF